ncbi:MAG: glycoside hydrolase family 57 protein [Candidatus Omnitrophota bacterium]|jgi:alpha-amylase/alpha-mannosidase (GH57 family)
MLHLAIVYHMHQPYYKNLLTGQMDAPWVRLHGIKDYLDMLLILKDYPQMKLTFNLAPCLIEQIEEYAQGSVQDKYLSLSYKPAGELTEGERQFILDNFFSLYPEYGIAVHPRYYQLYLKRQSQEEFDTQDLRDLQAWFNLAWFDPYFRNNLTELKQLIEKGRFFTEEEKQICLDKQSEILEKIIPTYQEFAASGQIEVIANPYYHPILPLLYNTKIAKQANPKTELPNTIFNFTQDAETQIRAAIKLYQERFGSNPRGMWPSEQAVSEHILDLFIQSKINWIISDEAILFKSLGKKKRTTAYLYKPYQLKRKSGEINIVFRDRNLSDLISFVYHRQDTKQAVGDFLNHLKNIDKHFKEKDPLVVIALDGENAWEYYKHDGWDFLKHLYHKLSTSDFLQTTTISEYLLKSPPKDNLAYLSPGSWVAGNFNKWIGAKPKNIAWELLTKAREELGQIANRDTQPAISDKLNLAWKQVYIAEGSDWFWWYGDTDDKTFDQLFRMHLGNLYHLLDKSAPEQLSKSII